MDELGFITASEQGWAPVTADKRELLEDFFKAVPVTKVDTIMGWTKGTTRGAIERGEMRFVPTRGKAGTQKQRLKVTPLFVAEWIANYCTCKKPLLEGWNEADAS